MDEICADAPRTITEHVAVTVARIRQEQRISLMELERRLVDLGEPIPRLGLSRLEEGKRKVSPEEIVALARALDVPPLLLMFPFDATEVQTQVLPGVVVNTRTAAKWFAGRAQLGDERGSAGQAAIRLFDDPVADPWIAVLRNVENDTVERFVDGAVQYEDPTGFHVVICRESAIGGSTDHPRLGDLLDSDTVAHWFDSSYIQTDAHLRSRFAQAQAMAAGLNAWEADR